MKVYNEGKLSQSAIVVALCAVCAVCAAVFLPVLMHPHWGLYSDSHQIVENCRSFYSASAIRWDLVQGYHRPGFHSLDLLVWLVSRENPLGFYLFRLLFFAGTVLLSYFSALRITSSRLISFLLAAGWFLLSSSFEVIYTLDKAETYISFLLSAIVYAQIVLIQKSSSNSLSSGELVRCALIIFFCASYAMLTKETGQLALPLTVAIPACYLAARLCTRGKAAEISADSDQGIDLLKTTGTFAAAGVGAYVLYKAYYYLCGAAQSSYGQLSFEPTFLWQQLCTYFPGEPEFFGILATCIIASVVALASGRGRSFQSLLYRFIATSFTFIVCVGSLALLSWKSIILYSWFPLYALILPAMAIYFAEFCRGTRAMKVLALAIIVLEAIAVPGRIVQAQLQYGLDDSVHELVQTIARGPAAEDASYGVPFIKAEYAELVEELESLTLSLMVPNYVESPYKAKVHPPRQFFDFINYNFPKEAEIPKTTQPLSSARLDNLPCVASSDYKNVPGINKFSYWSHVEPGKNWVVDNLRVGDVLLVPFGDVPPALATYRGLGLFCTDWRTRISFLPQLKCEPIFTIQRKVWRPGGKRLTLGWIGLAVKDSPALSWYIDRGGNLRDGTRIFAAKELAHRSLILTAGLSRAMLIWQRDGSKDIATKATPLKDNLLDVEFILPRAADDDVLHTDIHLQTFGSSTDLPFLNVTKATVK